MSVGRVPRDERGFLERLGTQDRRNAGALPPLAATLLLFALAALAFVVVVGLLAALDGKAASGSPRTFVLDKAEFVVDRSPTPPPDSAPWAPIALPDNWNLSRPGFSGVVWYRIELPTIENPWFINGIFVARNSARSMAFYVNGAGTYGTANLPDPRLRLFQQPIQAGVPLRLLRPGTNYVHVRVDASADLHQGLPRLVYGVGAELRKQVSSRFRFETLAYAVFSFAALVAGIAALVVWLLRREDAVLFWLAVAAILVGIPATAMLGLGVGVAEGVKPPVLVFYAVGFAPALAAALLHIAGWRRRVLVLALWAILATGMGVSALLGPHAYIRALAPLQVFFLSVLGALTAVVARKEAATSRTVALALFAALGLFVAFGLHDWAGWMGWLDFDRPALSQFAPPVLMLAIGALLLRRHLTAVAEAEILNRELALRVAERTAEIERAHAELSRLERVEAVARERTRIMSEIHDGVGTSLVGALSLVQASSPNLAEVEARLHDALQEMRLAVDSLDAAEGDLAALLGSVRHRLRGALEAAGVSISWRVGELPRLEHLTPTQHHQLMRIVTEALSNVIAHAGATRVEVETRVDEPAREVLITISDDGQGFDPATAQGGRGLANMRRRAAELGARLDIRSGSTGTRVVIAQPVGLSTPSPRVVD